MRDEKVMRLCEEWLLTEREIRASINPSATNFIDQAAKRNRADQLATCRNQLAVAAGINAEPAGGKEWGAE